MGRDPNDTTAAARVLAAYEAIVDLATPSADAWDASDPSASSTSTGARMGPPGLAAEARRMRERFEKRTGAFGPEDPWFEARSRALWDDALTSQGFATLAAPAADDEVAEVALRFARAHRGVFVVEDVDERGAHLVDLWSGAELLVHHLDEAQAVSLEHAEGPMDARVVAGPSEDGALFVLPGALHHGPDAMGPLVRVLLAAREREMSTEDVLDAILRMELAFRSSSRVKASFAYRVEGLSRARAG